MVKGIKIVENFKTISEYGFNREEMIEMVKLYPKININDFWDRLGINTGVIDNGHYITYPVDVELAIKCLLEGREKHPHEWD